MNKTEEHLISQSLVRNLFLFSRVAQGMRVGMRVSLRVPVLCCAMLCCREGEKEGYVPSFLCLVSLTTSLTIHPRLPTPDSRLLAFLTLIKDVVQLESEVSGNGVCCWKGDRERSVNNMEAGWLDGRDLTS